MKKTVAKLAAIALQEGKMAEASVTKYGLEVRFIKNKLGRPKVKGVTFLPAFFQADPGDENAMLNIVQSILETGYPVKFLDSCSKSKWEKERIGFVEKEFDLLDPNRPKEQVWTEEAVKLIRDAAQKTDPEGLCQIEESESGWSVYPARIKGAVPVTILEKSRKPATRLKRPCYLRTDAKNAAVKVIEAVKEAKREIEISVAEAILREMGFSAFTGENAVKAAIVAQSVSA